MKFLTQLLTLAFSCSLPTHAADLDACFVMRDLASGKTVAERGGARCRERVYACSTFKLPIALMAFDDGRLAEDTVFKWDGKKRLLRAWDRDQTPATWLRESVVWVSQSLMPEIGQASVEAHLKDFRYGNQDMSGGLAAAWLSASLKVSPEEQVDFLARLRRGELAVSTAAVSQLLRVMPSEKTAGGGTVRGKTGSGFSWEDPHAGAEPPFRVGWFVGYYEQGGRVYAFAADIRAPSKKGKFVFSGAEARKLALAALADAAGR